MMLLSILLILVQDDVGALVSDLGRPDRRPQAEKTLRARMLKQDIRPQLQALSGKVSGETGAIVDSILRLGKWRWLLSEELFLTIDAGIGFETLVDSIEHGGKNDPKGHIEVLAFIGDPEIVPFLKAWQERSEESFRHWPLLVRVVCQDKTALPDLVPLLKHSDKMVMGNAYALLYMYADASMVPSIKPLLNEPIDVKLRAYYLLDKLAPKEVEPVALEFIKETRPDLKVAGLRVLSKLANPAAIPLLMDFIKGVKEPEKLHVLMEWMRPFSTDEVLRLYSGMLEHQEVYVAKAALDAAIALEPSKSAPLLVKALSHWSDEIVVPAAAEALKKIDKAQWKDAVRGLLRAPVDITRGNAALVAGLLGFVEDKEEIERLTGDASPRVQRRALEALARLDMARAIPIAEKLATAPKWDMRIAAVSVLLQGDKAKAFPHLLQAVESGEQLEKGLALKNLQAYQYPDLEAVARKAFQSDLESVKLVALSILVERGTPDALDLTLGFIPQTQQLTSYVAFLVEQHFSDRQYAPAFAAALKKKDNDVKLKMLAAIWLGFFAGPETREALLPGLEDPDPRIRATVALALARIGEKEKTVPVLLELLNNPEVKEAGEVWVALGWTKDPRARAALVLALGSKDATQVANAVEGLGVMADPTTLPDIRPFLLSRTDALRDTALFAAARMGDKFATRRLYRRIDDLLKGPANGRPAWLGDLIFQLGHLRGERSMQLLQAALSSNDPALKIKAISGLQEIGTAEAVDLILTALDDTSFVGGQFSPQRFVRDIAMKSLTYLTGKRFKGSPEEQISAWRQWWSSPEGKSAYKK